MSAIEITEYTDPVCPFAWSAEPFRRRVEWLYGDQLSWTPRMVGLHESVEEMEQEGFTAASLAVAQAKLAHRHHMPIDTAQRSRLAASVPACRAVVAVGLHQPDAVRAMLRGLRVLNFAGELPDEPATLHEAARQAGVDPDALDRWLAEPATEVALRDDMRASRSPSPEAVALPDRLASTDDGGQRYTCPSWDVHRDGVMLSLPGFQPLETYLVALANIGPDLNRREDPEDVSAVLRWAAEPLATAEVAAVCGIEVDEAREQLGRVATEHHLGFDGLWTL